MTAKILPCVVLICSAVKAQAPPAQAPVVNASVSGVVKDRGTGTPLADYTVSTYTAVTWVNNSILMNSESKPVQSTTDAQGRYRLRDLPPGQYRIVAWDSRHRATEVTKNVVLAGHDLDQIDFDVVASSTIAGKVVDENKEAVPGIALYAISREYYLGQIQYFFKAAATTNDRGEYTFPNVTPGQPYLIMAWKREGRPLAHSDAPLNPKLRRRVPILTWYPNSPTKEGASAMILRAGERREGMDIQLRKSPSICIDGSIETPTGPAAMRFFIEPQQPSTGISPSGGLAMMNFGVVTAPDGEFRICDLYPGSFRLTASQPTPDPNQQPPTFVVRAVTIAEQDIHGLKLTTAPGLPIPGEVVLDGVQPETPLNVKVAVALRPQLRAGYPEEGLFARPDIPGSFSFASVLIDDYRASASVNSPGLYIKDVTYAGHSVRYEPLRVGSATSEAALRVTVGRDGSKVSARVADANGNPIPDMRVLVMPVEVRSEGMLAAALVSGQTDQAGQYTSSTLAPGKYYVAASRDSVNASPESIGKLWQARSRFYEVDLAPSATAQVKLEPIKIE